MEKINLKHVNTNFDSDCTIVFLHEGLGCIKSWKDYPEQICSLTNMSGIVYDRPGYGGSPGSFDDRSNNYLIEAADNLHKLVSQNNLQKLILYGHSDGGSIALAYAAKYPYNVVGIVSEAAHVIVEDITINGIHNAVKAFNVGKLDGLKKWHGKNYKSVFKGWANTWLKNDFDLKSLRALLPAVKAPQLIIQGIHDQYGSMAQVEIIQRETTGNTIVITPECGHSPYIERKSEVLEKAVQFIQSFTNGS